MYIFIDESGLFSPSIEQNQWSSVGAIAIPDESIKKVERALSILKKAHNLSNDEFKRNRPDSSSKFFIKFLKSLKKYKCTLHIVSTSGILNNQEHINTHKESTISAIKEFCRLKEYEDNYVDEVINSILKLSHQEYNQCIIQSYMIYNLIEKVISLYAQLSPASLSNFNWEIDQKNTFITTYDKVFKTLFIGLIEVKTKNSPFQIIYNEKKTNLSYFNKNFIIQDKLRIQNLNNETKKIYKKDFGENEKYLQALNLNKILLDNFALQDSKNSFGIQIADLLVSSVNRCLKGNFTNNKLMAESLGKIMINSCNKDEKSIALHNLAKDTIISNDVTVELIDIMDEASIKLYNFTKKIQSKNITKHSSE